VSAVPHRAFVALGANLGDREATIRRALVALDATPGVRVAKCSDLVETEPVGGPPQGKFLNGACEVRTSLSARRLLDVLLAIERGLGRVRTVRDGPRTLDLDLLLFDDLVIEERDLVVPHPRMAERPFVLAPLAEIAPDVRDPRTGRTSAELLASLRPDQSS
jgi:2-amino-4-hydroxy-6-hydroxymethyldihydropteridine diphosphokinase